MLKKKKKKKLPAPTTVITHVLWLLINNKRISERSTFYNGFRARIADLRNKYNLRIKGTPQNFTNRFNHSGIYHLYSIDKRCRKKFTQLYLRLSKLNENDYKLYV